MIQDAGCGMREKAGKAPGDWRTLPTGRDFLRLKRRLIQGYDGKGPSGLGTGKSLEPGGWESCVSREIAVKQGQSGRDFGKWPSSNLGKFNQI